MANWNTPVLTDLYGNFLQLLKDRDTDVLTMSPGTNIPVNSKRWDTATNTFQNWNGAAWVSLVLAAAGGGTGNSVPVSLGTMASQNANAVAITGGTISGVALNAGDITAGILALNRGGTGAVLALGAANTFLQSNGASVVFGTNGAALTNLNAAGLVGVIPGASIPNPLPAVSGANLTNLNAAQLVGTMPSASLPTASFVWPLAAGQFIQWPINTGLVGGTPIGGNKGGGSINAMQLYVENKRVLTTDDIIGGIPAGLIAMFDSGCPAGWTRFSAMDGRFPWGHGTPGLVGGTSIHNHHLGGRTNDTDNAFTEVTNIPFVNTNIDLGGTTLPIIQFSGGHIHRHQHQHPLDVMTDDADVYPPYRSVVFCMKD